MRRDIPYERYAGGVPSPFAVYRLPGLAGVVEHASPVVAHRSDSMAVGGPQVQEAQVNGPGGQIPFRRATTGRSGQIQTTGPQALTAAQQLVELPVDGSGFIYCLTLSVSAVAAANAAVVTYVEDAPYSALASIIFQDVTGETHNADGFSMHLAELYGGWQPVNQEASADPLVFQQVSGAAANGGSFAYTQRIPIGINERDLIGLLGNEDRAQRYFIRNDIAPSGSIYGTAPTTLPNITIARSYESYTVPAPTNSRGQKQETLPPKWGVIHCITRAVSPTEPAGGGTVPHYLPRLGNTIRNLICVFRSNGSRLAAEQNAPTRVALYIGDVPLYIDSWAAIRDRMWDQYGFDAPNGVIVYSFLHDFISPRAGAELMEDYLWTQQVTQAYLEVTYPAGFGSTNNSLTFITDDLKVPANVDLYN